MKTMSNKLTDKRLKEIEAFPITFDDDLPEFTDEELLEFKPAHPEYFSIKPKKKAISLKIDVDILEALKSQGKGYQTKINSILRKAVFSH